MTAPLNMAQGGSEGDEPAAAPGPLCRVRDWSTGGRCGITLSPAGRCRRHGKPA